MHGKIYLELPPLLVKQSGRDGRDGDLGEVIFYVQGFFWAMFGGLGRLGSHQRKIPL